MRINIGDYLFGEINNILITTYIDIPSYLINDNNLKELDLQRLFRLYIPKFSMGVQWDLPGGEEGKFLFYKLGPKFISYGLCEKIKVNTEKENGLINYEIVVSKEGYKYFAILENLIRIENISEYENMYTEKENKIKEYLNKRSR